MWDLPGVSTIHCSSGPAYLRGFDGVGLEMGYGSNVSCSSVGGYLSDY